MDDPNISSSKSSCTNGILTIIFTLRLGTTTQGVNKGVNLEVGEK